MPIDPVHSPLPLFDRLAADAESHWAAHDTQRLSIGKDLARLLNTRSRLDADAFPASAGTVLDYGVPDYSQRSPVSSADRDAVAALVRHAITLYEPRLSNVAVTLLPPPHGVGACVLDIRADMRVGGALRHVAFELNAAAPEEDGGRHG